MLPDSTVWGLSKIHCSQLFYNIGEIMKKYDLVKEPRHEKNLLMPYANNKDADQPAHPCSLISAFVVCCLDSIISLVFISETSSL